MKRKNCKMAFISFIFNRTLIKMLALTSTLALQNQIKGVRENLLCKAGKPYSLFRAVLLSLFSYLNCQWNREATSIFSNLVLSISFLFPYLPTGLLQLNQIMYVLQEN